MMMMRTNTSATGKNHSKRRQARLDSGQRSLRSEPRSSVFLWLFYEQYRRFCDVLSNELVVWADILVWDDELAKQYSAI